MEINVVPAPKPGEKADGAAIISGGGDFKSQNKPAKTQETPPKETPPKETPPKEEPKPSEKELLERRIEIMKANGWEVPKDMLDQLETASKAPAKAADKKTETPKAGEEPKPGEDGKPKPAAKKAPKETVTNVIQRTAKAVGLEVARELNRPATEPEPEKAETESDLTPEDQKDLSIIERMEKLNPERYKGMADKFRDFANQRYDYQAKWEKENPGKPFNPDDPEHEEFYRTQPQFDQEDFTDAKIDLRAEEQANRILAEKYQPALTRYEQQQALTAHQPIIAENVHKAVSSVLKEVNEDLLKHIVGEDGRIDIGGENIAKLREADPIAMEVLDPLISGQTGRGGVLIQAGLAQMIVELEKTAVPGLNFALDAAKNPVHAEIGQYVNAYEDEISKAPDEVRIQEGREFITIREYNRLAGEIHESKGTTEAKKKALAELDAQYWRVGLDDIERYITADISARAKAQIEHLEGLAARKYGKSGGGTETKAPQGAAAPAGGGTAATPRHRSPSVSSPSEVVTTPKSAGSGEKSFGETAVAVHWR